MKVIRKAAVVVGTIASVVAVVATLAGRPDIAQIATIVAAAAGAVASVSTMLMKRPTDFGGGSQTDFKADIDAGIPYAVGRSFMGGNIVHQDSFGAKRKYQSFVTVYSGAGPVQEFEAFKVDRQTVTFDGTTMATGYYADIMWLDTQLGASPESSALTSAMGAVPGWTSASKLSGYCASLWTLKYDVKGDRNYNNGVPKPGAVIKGVKVYDPRLDSTYPGGSGSCRPLVESTYVYSENPWLHALTYALGRFQNGKRVMGIGMALAGINVPAYVEAANIADANAWKVGGQIYSTEDKWDRLKAMAQAGGGVPMRLSAQLSCLVNAPRVSLATITSADLMGEGTNVTTQRRRDRINGVIPRYRSEAHDWEVVPAAVVRVPEYVTADGGERTREIAFPLVQSVNQAARLAAYEIVNAREMGPISLPLSTKWMGYKPGDCLKVDVPELGLHDQDCIIINRSLDPSTGIVTLDLKTETAGKHAFALGQTGTAPPVPDTMPPADADEIAAFNKLAPGDFTNAIANSYTRDLAGNITQTNAGSDVTITIPNHTRVYGGVFPEVSVTGTSLTGIPYSGDPATTLMIYYDDPDLAGGAVSYQTTTIAADAYFSAGHPYRHFIGYVTVMTSAGTGGGTGGSGTPGSGGWTNDGKTPNIP